MWTRLDTATGEAQLWGPGPRCFCEELMFVPGPRGAEAEDDGYLLGMYFDAELERSCLVVCSPFKPPSDVNLWVTFSLHCRSCFACRASSLQ